MSLKNMKIGQTQIVEGKVSYLGTTTVDDHMKFHGWSFFGILTEKSAKGEGIAGNLWKNEEDNIYLLEPQGNGKDKKARVGRGIIYKIVKEIPEKSLKFTGTNGPIKFYALQA